MATRQFYEAEQHVNVAGTEQLIYQPPGGEVAVIQKLKAVNTNTSTSCIVNLWIDPDGGSSVAAGDRSHFVVELTLAGGETANLGGAGVTVPSGGQIYVDVNATGGGNFQSSVNIVVSGILITQSRSADATSAA